MQLGGTQGGSEKMDIDVERKNETLIAQVTGRVDSANAREFEQALSSAIGDDRKVILDLGNLSYISSSGLRVLLLVAKALRNKGAEFALCSLSDPIREIFEISGFDKIIPIYGSLMEVMGE